MIKSGRSGDRVGRWVVAAMLAVGSLALSSCGLVPLPQLPGVQSAPEAAPATPETPAARARALMARGADLCKEMITEEAKGADSAAQNASYEVRGTYYIHRRDTQAGLGMFGVAFFDPDTSSETQTFDGSALVLLCVGRTQEAQGSLFVEYLFDDLPAEFQSGLVTGELTNAQVQTAALGLPDAKLAKVTWRNSMRGVDQFGLVGFQRDAATGTDRRFGIRAGTLHYSNSDLFATPVVVPDDDDFSVAADRVDGIVAPVEETLKQVRKG